LFDQYDFIQEHRKSGISRKTKMNNSDLLVTNSNLQLMKLTLVISL